MVNIGRKNSYILFLSPVLTGWVVLDIIFNLSELSLENQK